MLLGRYQIVKHLAEGGMADVFLARTTGIEGWERHVVIKRIRAEQARDASYVAMFLDEARLAAALHHSNIGQVNDIGEANGEYFFAMDYIHGEDVRRILSEVCKRGTRVPLAHVVAIAAAAAAGLHHAHEQRGPDRKPLGIVHRDVSPANILVGYDGNVKVVDFGIAKAAHRTTETRSGTLKGKVAYMSPEQCLGAEVDRRSDVFALGVVLYELATVRRLFKFDNDFLTMSAIVRGDVPKPSSLCPDLPAMLEAIILKALAKDPRDRFSTTDDLRRALERFAASHQIHTSTTALADYMTELFGARPQPWLVDDADADAPEIELGYDFDGSASGLVHAPTSGLIDGQVVTAAPIGRARARVATAAPPVAPHVPARRARRPLIAAAVVAFAVVAISLGAVAAMRDAPVATAIEASVPLERETVREPVRIAAPRDARPASVAPASTVPAPAAPIVKKTVKRAPAPVKHWDPNALFPP